jgi:hypothetical protein
MVHDLPGSGKVGVKADGGLECDAMSRSCFLMVPKFGARVAGESYQIEKQLHFAGYTASSFLAFP